MSKDHINFDNMSDDQKQFLNELWQKPKSNRKPIIYICSIVAVLIVAFMVFYKCDKKPYNEIKQTATVQPLIDQKQNLVDSLLLTVNRLVASINSSKQSIVIQRDGFQTAYQNSLQTSPDVCLPVINVMYKQAMRLDSTSQVVIKKQDSTIVNQSKALNEQKDISDLQKFQLQQKADSIAGLLDINKQDKRTSKNQKIKNFFEKLGLSVLSFGAGYGTGKVLP